MKVLFSSQDFIVKHLYFHYKGKFPGNGEVLGPNFWVTIFSVVTMRGGGGGHILVFYPYANSAATMDQTCKIKFGMVLG